MPPPSTSPVTGATCPPSYIHANSAHFRDVHGRTLLLRGVNVCGSAKTPQGQPQQKLEGFWETGESGDMSFVDRVFDLGDGGHDTDVHLRRLKAWGFNTLRYIFTWESIEHKGPGQYDREFLDYTVRMLRKIHSFGFRVYMDPHQDLMSRFSGGCGAPYWAIIACGLNPRHFTATSAALLQCEWPSPDTADPENFPDMIWASNYTRLAVQTMFTLFWAGRDFAPKCVIDGVNIQDWLQRHYIDSVAQLAAALREAGDLYDVCIIGWDSMNEANEGYVGLDQLDKHASEGAAILRIGPTPTAFEAMRLGMGEKLTIENWRFGPLGPKRDGSVTIDPQGKRAWLDPEVEDADGRHPRWGWQRAKSWPLGQCIWALHGVWDPATSTMLQRDYFAHLPGTETKARFSSQYWRAHIIEWSKMIRSHHAEAIMFLQPPVFQVPPDLHDIAQLLAGRACYSTHFYDGLTLITKHWNWFNADAVGMLRGKYRSVLQAVRIGEANIRKCLREQLAILRQDTFDALGQYPTMFGELGIPFDLDQKTAYRTGDYHNQVRALDASLNACDGPNVLNYSIWTYVPDNSHQWGDNWNTEDLSIWSADDAARKRRQRGTRGQRTMSSSYHYSAKRIGPIVSRQGDQVSDESVIDDSDDARPPSRSSVEDKLSVAPSLRPDASMTTLLQPSQSSLVDASPTTAPRAHFADDARARAGGDGETVSYVEINDGARALPAFVRPYPIATVGVPVDINFDVKSSEFTLTVEVRHDDVAPDADVATDVFLPLVHYALAPRSVAAAAREATADTAPIASLASSLTSGSLDDKSTRSLLDDSPVEQVPPGALDLDVEVSAGTWTNEGQHLHWTYPVPQSADEGPFTYRLRVVRKSGPIAAWTTQMGDPVVAPWRTLVRRCVACAS